MNYLGRHVAGTSIWYGAHFHSDQGNVEDPTTPTARIRTPAGAWSDLTTPAKQDGKTGFYGGTVDTTGFAAGQYSIAMQGVVTTAKTVGTQFGFDIALAPAVAGDIPTAAAVADKVLGRTISGGADGGRTVTSALRALRNKVTRVGAVLSVKQEDDTTEAWAAALTTDAAALPVVGVDPA